MAELVGTVSAGWAQKVGREAMRIFQYNRYNAEAIQDDITLRYLGGLSVRFGQKILLPADVSNLRESHSTVDLAFEEPSIVTSTRYLLEASREQRGEADTFTLQLLNRSTPNLVLGHGGDERWLVPVRAVILATVENLAPVGPIA